MTVIPDASLVVKWFKVEDPPEDQAAALRLLEDIDHCRVDACWAPSLLSELLGALSRADLTPEQVETAFFDLQTYELDAWTLEPEIAKRALELHQDRGISTYDAEYVAIAEYLGGTWVTFDRKAHNRIADLGLSMVPGAARTTA